MNIIELPANVLSSMIKRGETSASDVLEFFIEQIEKNNPEINSFITYNFENARADAKLIDEKIAKKEQTGRLAGVPIAIKDNISVKGVKTTCGSKMLENFTPVYNATVVERLKAEDAIIIGKTNMDEFAMGSSNEFSAFGTVKNPIDKDRVPGGSSGGSTAAVADHQASIALGSDTGGSIRQPAAFCGNVGFKPSYGRISRYGLVAFASSLDQIGPITKTVADAKLVFDIIQGLDENDSTTKEFGNTVFTHKPRIACLKQSLADDVDPMIKESIENTIDLLNRNCYKVDMIDLDILDSLIPIYYIIAPAECSANLSRYDGVRYGHRFEDQDTDIMGMYRKTRGNGFGNEVKRRIMLGTFVLSAGYQDEYFVQAQKSRRLVIDHFNKLFENYDLILSPTTPSPAFKFGEKLDDPVSMYLSDLFTVSANLIGAPAISIPYKTEKLPVGIHLMAKPGFDYALLDFAQELEGYMVK